MPALLPQQGRVYLNHLKPNPVTTLSGPWGSPNGSAMRRVPYATRRRRAVPPWSATPRTGVRGGGRHGRRRTGLDRGRAGDLHVLTPPERMGQVEATMVAAMILANGVGVLVLAALA